MKASQFSSLFLAVYFASGISASAEGNRSMRQRFKELESQLASARESMHEAQRELAKKAEHIQTLERQLKSLAENHGDTGAVGTEKMRQEIVALRHKNAAMAKELTALKKNRTDRPGDAEKGKKPKNSATNEPKQSETITIGYEANTAANYEGREKVLEWIEDRMKTGIKNFGIEGFANDSVHPDVCQEIAKNRAKYLADYLILRGVPEDALSLSASVAKEKGGKGRVVLVSVIRQ